ncbi:MAG: TfuA-like protein [Rhizobiaceae bacterium]|nr:TfuA-like protein [Rhizobiaceae bacterium]
MIFAGPTLRSIPRDEAFDWRPPARRGDIYRAALAGTRLIGLVDGCFKTVPSVLHKEILWAMTRGCAVYGAASMGALRAAELHSFGMIGIGAIFRDFATGRLTRDDEVAIEHGPAELDFPHLSEALVNIRYTLANAVACSLISDETATRIAGIAAATFYARRDLGRVIDAYNARSAGAVSAESRERILRNRVNQKMLDGVELLARVKHALETGSTSSAAAFTLEETGFFVDFRNAMESPIVRDFG